MCQNIFDFTYIELVFCVRSYKMLWINCLQGKFAINVICFLDELTCCCCTIHKNGMLTEKIFLYIWKYPTHDWLCFSGETMKNVLKQQILMRNILTQVLNEIQNLKIPQQLTNTVETIRESVFVTFNFFPINNDEQLNLVEIYLENQTNFKATVSNGNNYEKLPFLLK